MISFLKERKVFDSEFASALSDLIFLSNQAIHGAYIEPDVARRTIAAGENAIGTLTDLIELDEMARKSWDSQR